MMFKMRDVVDPSLVVELEAATREGVIRGLVAAMAAAGAIAADGGEDLVHWLMKREGLDVGSTGIGNGVAIPHTRSTLVGDRVLLVVARNTTAIDWDAIDGLPVRLFFCIVSPPARPGDRLRTQEAVARFLFRVPTERLLAAKDFNREFLDLAREFDERGG